MRRGVRGVMSCLRILFGWLLIFATACPALADHAESAYKAGVRAEKQSNYDVAFEEYRKAHTAKPTDAKYMAAYTRTRYYASAQHVHNGQLLLDAGKLQEALADFRLA